MIYSQHFRLAMNTLNSWIERRYFSINKRHIYLYLCGSFTTKFKLIYRYAKKNLIRTIACFILFAFLCALPVFRTVLISYDDPHSDHIIISPTINMLDVLLPSSNTINVNDESNMKTQSTLVYTCLGEKAFSYHQKYIWKSLEQARLVVGPSFPIFLIISEVGHTENIRKRLRPLNITLVIYEHLMFKSYHNTTLFLDFHQTFFVQGAMEPGGNVDFNRLTSERLFAIYAFMKVTGKSDVFHLENDNMLYGDLDVLLHRMRVCRVFLGFPRAAREYAVISFLYIRNAYALEHFLRFIIEVFRLGRIKAVNYINQTYINEMTIASRYLDLFSATSEDSKLSGIFQLPTELDSRDCCLCDRDDAGESIIFDARTLGQYFGADYHKPHRPLYWLDTELVDPRRDRLEWKNKRDIRLPYIRGFRIVNLHVHSKRLRKFVSNSRHQITGENFNNSLVHD